MLNRALIAQGRRKGLLWDEPAPLGTAGWHCCGPTCPPCTALPRRCSPKHLPTVMDEHHPDHQPHLWHLGTTALSPGHAFERRGRAGRDSRDSPCCIAFLSGLQGSLSLKASPRAPRDFTPQLHTLPTRFHSRAWPHCSERSCTGQSEIHRSPKSLSSPSTPHMGWQHPGHDKTPATSAFLLPSPCTITCAGRSSTRYTVHGVW